MVCLLAGCDDIRRLAGRPTSGEIEARRQAIEQEAEALQQRKDSLDMAAAIEQDRIRRRVVDSLNLMDSLRRGERLGVISPDKLDPEKAQLNFRYYVMIGAFGSPANAARQAARAEAAGYPATTIPLKNGIVAVGVCGTNSLTEIAAAHKKISAEPFCPADAWILDHE